LVASPLAGPLLNVPTRPPRSHPRWRGALLNIPTRPPWSHPASGPLLHVPPILFHFPRSLLHASARPPWVRSPRENPKPSSANCAVRLRSWTESSESWKARVCFS